MPDPRAWPTPPRPLPPVPPAAPADASDRELLLRYAVDRHPAAFAALVDRHGPFVLWVCRRAAGHPDDAADAFLAVFLALARAPMQAGRPDLLAVYLFGVAVRAGAKARRTAWHPAGPGTPPPAAEVVAREVDAQLAELPDQCREAVVLCDVLRVSPADAAARLGVPEATVGGWLSTGRWRIGRWLKRRGMAAAVEPAGAVAVPPELRDRAVALATTAGPPPGVALLATGSVLKRAAAIAADRG